MFPGIANTVVCLVLTMCMVYPAKAEDVTVSDTSIGTTYEPPAEMGANDGGTGTDDVVKAVEEPWPTDCIIKAGNPQMFKRVKDLLAWKIKLIEYKLNFPNYTANPLTVNVTDIYRPDTWSRVSSTHGQTLLSLAFNHGIMSLWTLQFGVESVQVDLHDSPSGCFGSLDEDSKVATVIHLLMRDFRDLPAPTLVEAERVCHEVILSKRGVARFRDRCCFVEPSTGKTACTTKVSNIWLVILYTTMACVKVLVIFFGPSMFIVAAHIISNQHEPFVVKLKEPLKKRMMLCRKETEVKVSYQHTLDFRSGGPLPKLRKSISGMPVGEIIETQVSQYDILVDYGMLLTEYMVPVGLLQCLARAICFCKMQNIEPFKRCCQVSMFRSYDSEKVVPWISFWRRVAAVLVLIFIPTPFYIRVFVYYKFEQEQVLMRKSAARAMGLSINYDNSLVHYLTPTHPVFVCIYLLYFVLAFLMLFMITQYKGRHLKRIVINAFKDLERVSWMKALYLLVSNFIWPFERFGVLGVFVAPFYWLVAMPISIVLAVLFCLPATYVFFRMMVLSTHPSYGTVRTTTSRYIVERNEDDSIVQLETIRLIKDPNDESDSDGNDEDEDEEKVKEKEEGEDDGEDVKSHLVRPVGVRKRNSRQTIGNIIGVVVFLISLLSFLLVFAECLGFLIEMVVFTLMGIIVNAGQVLKYVTLLFIVIIYSFDCYSNVTKKYLNLNKGLFSEVKGRIKDLEEVTALPSHLQENQGFKAVENSEQADYESPDDLSEKFPKNWNINDLILFIDNEDMPRIPRQLFDEVCQISVVGSPGPVYRSLLTATQDFLKMVIFLLFVFLIVLSFGAVYQVNSTNQTLATMAGGFLPLMMRNFMKPTTPDIEFGTVSFKSKLDEIMQNFQQKWPLFDFPFELPSEEESDDESGEDSSSDEDSKKKKDKKDKKKKKKDDKKSGPGGELNNNVGAAGIATTTPSTSAEGVQQANSETSAEEERKFEVDILVYLPEDSAEGWLEEWSDYDQYAQEVIQLQEANLEEETKLDEVAVDTV